MSSVVFQFNAKLFDFSVQGFVFFRLALQETHADPHLRLDALRGKKIQVSTLAGAIFEISRLDQTFFYQRFEAIVRFAKAHAQILGEFPLADLRVFLQITEELKVDFLVDLAHAIQPWQRPDWRGPCARLRDSLVSLRFLDHKSGMKDSGTLPLCNASERYTRGRVMRRSADAL